MKQKTKDECGVWVGEGNVSLPLLIYIWQQLWPGAMLETGLQINKMTEAGENEDH